MKANPTNTATTPAAATTTSSSSVNTMYDSFLAKRRTMRLFSFTAMVAVAWESIRHNLKNVQILGTQMQTAEPNRGLTSGGGNNYSSSHRDVMELLELQEARHLEKEAQLTKWQQELEAAKQDLQRKEQQEPQNQQKKQVATMEDRDNYSSVCLMIMDANHEIIEWIAYHYHTMNLRRLIVYNDPKSRTTPLPILQRWQDKINITLWDAKNGHPGYDPTGQYELRQKKFYGQCYKTLKEEGHRWVAAFDPDEYATVNERVYIPDEPMYQMGQAWLPPSIDRIPIPTAREPGSTLKFIMNIKAHIQKYGLRYNNSVYLKPFETACVQANRKQYSPYEPNPNEQDNRERIILQINKNDTDPPFPFDDNQGVTPSDLNTWKWRYWGKIINKKKMLWNHVGKAILDFKSLNHKDLPDLPNVHAPITETKICTDELKWANEHHMPLVMHHYPLTFENSMFRATDSRGRGDLTALIAYRRERFNTELAMQDAHEPHGHILEWLIGFAESVGTDEASRLLHGAGDPKKAHEGAWLDPRLEPDWTAPVARSQLTVLPKSSPPQVPMNKKQEKQVTLEFVHIPKSGGTAIELAAARESITWGICHYMRMPKQNIPATDNRPLPGCSLSPSQYVKCPKVLGFPCWHRPTSWSLEGFPWAQNRSPNTPYRNKKLFAIVRNPYTRMVSEYYCPWKGYKGPDPINPSNLNQFLQRKIGDIKRGNYQFNDHAIPQAHFIFALTPPKEQHTSEAYHFNYNRTEYSYTVSSTKVVDHVIYYEKLSEQFRALMMEYDLPVVLPDTKVNAGREKKLTYRDLDDTTIELINQFYKDDFDLLGYSRIDTDNTEWKISYDPSSTFSEKSKVAHLQ